jgi:hypothetical protein
MQAARVRWLAGERAVLGAWLILLFVSLLLAILLPNDHRSILDEGVLAVLEAILAIALVYGYLVLVIRWSRGPERTGVWGYVWRSYVLLLLDLLPLVAWTMSHLMRGRTAPAEPRWILALLITVGSPVLAWPIFGGDRTGIVRRLTGRHNPRPL